MINVPCHALTFQTPLVVLTKNTLVNKYNTYFKLLKSKLQKTRYEIIMNEEISMLWYIETRQNLCKLVK